ncbi:MAG: Tim44 domain-containing protein [Neisseriaceae bacterium]|jgi:predicted lipid-binding transport protein (Tim44 family)|nr:MAG: Tim44 domain-containing protein [Neisseriaceae bacterium]
MPKPTVSLIAMLVVATMATAPLAEAARLGGGKSSGMSRSYSRPAPAQNYSRPAQPAPQPQYQQPAPQPQRSGPGWGGVAAGAAAGAAAGYLLGQSGNNHATAPNAAPTDAAMAGSQAPQSSFPWGMVLLLGGLTVVGYMLFRRKTQQAGKPAYNGNIGGAFGNNPPAAGGSAGRVFRIGEGAMPASAAPLAGDRLPDGTETASFLRQAKASFMHLQTMNSPESVDELRKYLTPEMFEAIKADVAANKDTAEFPTLNAEVVEAATDGDQYVASVRFHGMVSESLNAPVQPFEELWHFVKPASASSLKWLVAGIQQL